MFDLSNFTVRRIFPEDGLKPLDFGNKGVSGSISPDGRILNVTTYHPMHGSVSLTSVPRSLYDWVAKRRRFWDAQMPEYDTAGFGLEFNYKVVARAYYLVEDVVPLLRLTFQNGIIAECLTYATLTAPVGVAQEWRFSKAGVAAKTSGLLWLQRTKFIDEPQIVDNPDPDSVDVGLADGTVNYMTYRHLPATLHIQSGLEKGKKHNFVAVSKNRLSAKTRTFNLALGLSHDVSFSRAAQRNAATTSYTSILKRWQKRWRTANLYGGIELAQKRALAKALRSFIPVDDEAVSVVTDGDRPLSRNSETYYLAAPLLNWNYEARHLVRGHLVWLFERADRSGDGWHKSYLATGQGADTDYDFDQQVYPLLLLADYVQQTGDKEIFEEFKAEIDDVLTMLDDKQDTSTGLLPSSNDADDDTLPYEFSSHVLLWQALNQLEAINHEGDYAKRANRLQATLDDKFLIEHEGKPMYASSIDGAGNYTVYDDPNDIPLMLMAQWDYVASDDPTWRNTLAQAFAKPTSDPALSAPETDAPEGETGDTSAEASSTAIAPITDNERLKAIIAQIERNAQWDGSLPEFDAEVDTEQLSKHRFASQSALLLYLQNLSKKE